MFAIINTQPIQPARLDTSTENSLARLYKHWSGKQAMQILPLPLSGSNRSYFRIEGQGPTVIGTYHNDLKENDAFIAFSRHFQAKGIAAPEVYAESRDQGIYLQEDLGDKVLFGLLAEKRAEGTFPLEMYRKAIEGLIKLQVEGFEGWDFSKCYPIDRFDRQAILWDLNYFKYYFLKLSGVPFHEQLLERDFQRLADYLEGADANYLIHRDFQARNIMLVNDQPYFIDYQGGRQGPLQYDLASLLYQAKACIPQQTRQELLEFYLDQLKDRIPVNRERFKTYFYGFVLIRTLQVLGAYGFRGFYERKPHFLESIPFAIDNLTWLLHNAPLEIEVPHLWECLNKVTKATHLWKPPVVAGDDSRLEVEVTSFSYKRGLPVDPTEHGGGFIFDCRAIHNPGRYQPYKHLTGRDPEVKAFLKKNSRVDDFLRNSFELVDASVESYLSRNFTRLAVHFGCTGGQHRSVYCADRMAEHLEKKYKVRVKLSHREQERKGWKN